MDDLAELLAALALALVAAVALVVAGLWVGALILAVVWFVCSVAAEVERHGREPLLEPR